MEKIVWCNNCHQIYKKTEIDFSDNGLRQYCPNCGLAIGCATETSKRCVCGEFVPANWGKCPNCVASEKEGSV